MYFKFLSLFLHGKVKSIALINYIMSLLMRNSITSFLFLLLSYLICIVNSLLGFNSVMRRVSRNNRREVLSDELRQSFFDSIIDYEKIKIKYLSHYAKNNKSLKNQIANCGSVLESAIKNVSEKTGSKVILMPMHIFSDEFACLIAAHSTDKRLWCLSNVGNNGWKKNWNRSGCPYDDNVIDNLYLINVLGNESASKKEIVSMMRSFKRGAGECLVFLDAIPEYTAQYLKGNKFMKVSMFNKVALMHRGPFKLPESLNAVILPYYVHIRLGMLKLETLPYIEAQDVDREIPKTVEKVLISKVSNQWMFWHFSSFFYYNG
ncbi:hypothetical protein [Shewanella japonica]|uniref:Lipid A biosynthesis acyltransferase n=1 Tax=Shewanella japonica TaxID=93973 RepID=A0ABM6JK19_9GAMM|nr:hypothetical protein [Shewanella japonica]ARD22472.1 hypothetical protein SJ2017_2175 [Shewanella japonica]